MISQLEITNTNLDSNYMRARRRQQCSYNEPKSQENPTIILRTLPGRRRVR
jgi:hypothetical protein